MPQSESQGGTASAARYALPAIVLGGLLLGISFLPSLAGGHARWTKDQALEYQQASMRIQELTHDLGSQSPDTASPATTVEFRAALDHFHNLESQLKDAREQSGHGATVLRVVGLLLAIGGTISLVPKKRKAGELRPFTAVRDSNR